MDAVDVVVVAYNSRGHLRTCVEPLAQSEDLRVIIVENASGDGSLETVADLERVTAIQAPVNRGFAAGCNLGWRAGTAADVLFLNPDATTTVESVRTLARVLRVAPHAGAVAPRIVEPEGRLDFSLRRFPTIRSTYAQAFFLHRVFPRRTWTDEVDRDREHYERSGVVEWVSGAAVMVRRTVLEQLDGWDETYFHYGEDVDICRRIWDLGFEIRYEPTATVVHEGGGSAPRPELLPLLAENRLRYVRKHGGRVAAAVARGGIALNSVTHFFVGRGGRATRRGHAAAFKTMLRPVAPDARPPGRFS
jgi:GT2 family glycosyltransferase